jgi:hypothetical protein
MTQAQARQVLLKTANVLLETVQECPQGAPAGVMYAAVMGIVTLDQFEVIMSALVEAGKVRKSNNQYFPIK